MIGADASNQGFDEVEEKGGAEQNNVDNVGDGDREQQDEGMYDDNQNAL